MKKYKVTLGRPPHKASFDIVEADGWEMTERGVRFYVREVENNALVTNYNLFYIKEAFWKIERVKDD